MKSITVTLDRYEPIHGWANRLLRVDLSEMRIWAQETAPYVPAYLGARGVAARLCWDEYPEPVDPFCPANPLMVITGALTGSRAPYSGRTTVHAFSPQAWPHPWFTRSSIGGRFGGELKRAGYDGIVVTGASETPVQIQIRDDEVSIVPAESLWGLDIMDTLETIESTEGKGVRSLVIGPAGERLSRIAVIQTSNSSSAGQGGFGAVMGSKKLKAITVRGTGRVSLAEPGTMTALTRELARRFKEAGRDRLLGFGRDLQTLNRELEAEGNGRARRMPCTEGCLTPCNAYFQDVPGAVYERKWSGRWFCISEVLLPELLGFFPKQRQALWDWRLDRRAGFEVNVLSNRYGLNQCDLLMGIVPWLTACQASGAISEVDGVAALPEPMDWSSPILWAELLRTTAYREGLGDVLAEGGWRAAQTLGIGLEIARTLYAGWGQPGHWDGHTEAWLSYPYWLVSALQWMSDTRDPFSTGRSSLWPNRASRVASRLAGEEREVALEKIRALGQRLYGSADAVDPHGGYGGKARAGHYHTVRPVILDCVPVDVYQFPLLYDGNAPDGCWRFDVEGIGEIEGPSIEYHLFRAGTGLDWPEAEFERGAERVVTLERALQVRHWGRDRRLDESILPHFEREEFSQSPYLDRRYGLDRAQFDPVVDEFYALHGWDRENGWPTRERLVELDMADVYEPMVAGAEKRGKAAPSGQD